MRKSLFPFIPFLLLVIPVLEIGVFILIGGQIGVINTLLGVVLTAFIGTVLLRQQGFALVSQAQRQMDQGRLPGKELAHGVMLLAAGLLLLTPGFVTDTIGFLLLVPPIRDAVFAFFKSRVTFTSVGGQGAHFSQGGPGAGQGGAYYSRSYTYSSSENKRDNTRGSRPSDPSIIDLDEEDFDEVSNRDTLEGPEGDDTSRDTRGNSPWNGS